MLYIAGKWLDPKLVVLDKDGTLILFDDMWRAWFERILAEIEREVALSEATREGLAATLGYDAVTGDWDPFGPLTIASTREIGLLIAGLLYRYHALPWDRAVLTVDRAEKAARASLSVEQLAKPIGDVRGLLQRLADSGVTLALATTDDRAPTERALRALGIERFFAAVVCGDEGIPLKPAPDMALEICRRLGVAPAEAIMVGDTLADLAMAREAGFQQAVGVASGALTAEELAPHADVVIPDIHAIHVIYVNSSQPEANPDHA